MKILKKTPGKISYVRTLLPTLLTIALFIIAIFMVVIPQFENIILDRKREMIRELTNSTVSMINRWHQVQLKGMISEDEAKKNAIDLIKNLRYGEELKDYFWVTDLHPNMIVHPYRPELDGNDLSNFEDLKDKKLFVEMVKAVQNSGEGYVDYMWQWKDDSTKIVPKLSYVKKFEPWNWVIGTGIYIEDVRLEIKLLERKILTISVIVTILSSLLLSYIAFRNIKNEKLRKKAEDDLHESREKYRMLVEASGEGLIMILDNKQTFYNKTFYSMLGYSDSGDDFNFSGIFKSIPDSKFFDFSQLQRKTPEHLFNEQIETRLIKKNGELLNVLLNISSISFMNNNGIVINVKDLTLHEEMKEALDYTKEKFISLTNRISVGVFRATFDRKFNLIEVNSALLTILRFDEEAELIGRSLFEFINDEEVESLFFEELNNNGFIKNRIIKLKTEKGKLLTASLSAAMVKGINSENSFIDGFIQDVSEQQHSIQERDELISDLQSSVVILSQKITPYIKHIPSCVSETSIHDASKIMTQENSNAILVKGKDDLEMGIITAHELRDKVISAGNKLNLPVETVMNTAIVSIKTTATIYDALLLFIERNSDHLIVKDLDGKIQGVIDYDVLLNISYSKYLFFISKIEDTEDVQMLVDYRSQLILLIAKLINNDVDIRTSTKIISLVADSISRKVINLAIKELGPPPCNFAFISMGSEGREEQTLLTDQDNAIIYEDPEQQSVDEIHNYFLQLGQKISGYLNSAGYSYCKGNIMASNSKFCQPLSVWKKYFTNWVTEANPKDLLDLKIFFDLRVVFGESQLTSQLKNHINRLINSSSNFFLYLSESLVHSELPESILKLKGPVDLKLSLLPVIDFARLYGLKYNLTATNTIERLEYIYDQGIISNSLFKNILFSYSLLMNLRLRHQSELYFQKSEIGNSISPNSLTEIQILLFKKYFELLKEIKDRVSLDFKGTLMR